MSNPIMNERTHRLSDLPGIRHPECCQKCGGKASDVGELKFWIEHDHRDNPECCGIVLCEPCAKRIIDPHPRLYSRLTKWAPWPGFMALCVACIHRNGVACECPSAKANGGEGIKIKFVIGISGYIDGKDYSGPFRTYSKPPSGCTGRQEIPA